VQTAYDRLAYFALRPALYFDRAADVQPTNQSMPGSSVVFNFQNDLAIASTPLNESTDVTAVALSSSQVTVTLAEYGNATITTAALRAEGFVDIDPIQANVIGYNAAVSIDEVAKNVLVAGNNVDYSTGTGAVPTARNMITPLNTLRATDCRLERARLVESNVPTFGGYYVAYIHPDVAFDLRAETGSGSWRQPHEYSQPGEIWSNEVGVFEGSRFVEVPRAPIFADAGSSTTDTDVYATLFVGRQSLAKIWALKDGNGPSPKVVQGPITDKLRRFVPLGWYWLGGYSLFRQASIRRVESASSIGDNAAAGTFLPAIDL
jgi:N4-gp56 family major capsid protein